MDATFTTKIILLSPALGMLHALDADHVVAVSTLAAGRAERTGQPWRHGLHWALGHGAMLLALGVVAFGIGRSIPALVAVAAESLVALIMIVMGLALLLRSHRIAPVAVCPSPHPGEASRPHPQPAATGLGALHGMAGSAPLLALVPAAAADSLWEGLAYLLLFGAGVVASMLLFTHLLGALLAYLARFGPNALALLRYTLATASMGVGAGLLAGTL